MDQLMRPNVFFMVRPDWKRFRATMRRFRKANACSRAWILLEMDWCSTLLLRRPRPLGSLTLVWQYSLTFVDCWITIMH